MLGLLALGFTSLMIYTLVRNALFGVQLNKNNQYPGTIDVLIPVENKGDIKINFWRKLLRENDKNLSQFKFHFLLNGLQDQLADWQELAKEFESLKVHHFTLTPTDRSIALWMLGQISSQIQSSCVMILDPQVIPTQDALNSLAFQSQEKQSPLFAVPQVAKTTTLGQAIYSVSPTLAFTSLFGTKNWRLFLRKIFPTTEGLMCLSLKEFKDLNFNLSQEVSWKDTVLKHWEEGQIKFKLAFGEKFLVRQFDADLGSNFQDVTQTWEKLWLRKNKSLFWLYLFSVFVWSFPVICFVTHPFWALASFFLLVLYRFFTKIVFQESWTSVVLHPFSSCFWIVGLGNFVIEEIKRRRRSSAH